MSFLRKLFGKPAPSPEQEEPPPQPALPDPEKAGQLLDCKGVEWNREGQIRFLDDVLASLPPDRFQRLLKSDGFAGNPYCNPTDAAVLFAVISHFEPSRIMELGCGYTTRVIRAAKDAAMMPGELIAIDPEPRAELIEYVDAHLADPLQEVPVDDFHILQPGELVLMDLPATTEEDGPARHFFGKVLPAIGPGVLVGFHGIRLPRQYNRDELLGGFAAQELLLEHLAQKDVEILFSGGWLLENDRDRLASTLPQGCPAQSVTAFWMRTK